MKTRDLFNISIHNLARHRSRTILTVLGVIIGCCSVVIMISFGIGMKISQEAMLTEMGDLRVIDVYTGYSDTGKAPSLTDSIIESMKKIENVVCVNPQIDSDTNIRVGVDGNDRFKRDWADCKGITPEAIEEFGYEIKEGTNFSNSSRGDVIEALAGEYFAYGFTDSQRPDGYNQINYWDYIYNEDGAEDLPDPYVDPLDTTFVISMGDEDKAVTRRVKIVGIMKEDYSKDYITSEGLYIKADDMKKLNREYRQLVNYPAENEQSYSYAQIMVNDIKNVENVEKSIQELGFSTSSLESLRESMEKDVRQRQLMFAGLGIVSLFVAALGIMNTMFMAISERKKEIGVMKALGCPLNSIRAMFLMEAGFIGLIGGILGVFISLAVSSGINIVSSGAEITDYMTLAAVLFTNTDRVSVIPVWLSLSSVVFSIFVGLVSGYWPANSAVKISVLDAIHSE